MGNNWSLSGAWQQTVVTQDDIIDAVRGFESWQKAQEEMKASGVVQHFDASSTLLDRVGGPTIVRRAVEIFCRRMYADKQLAPYLAGTDIIRLRAKQSSFLLWLLSPDDQPASSRHPRTAHLPLIRTHGFNRDHFRLGLRFLSEALREAGVAEVVMSEVMDKLRPYEDMTFTPLPREDEEERRLAAFQRLRSSQQMHQQGQAHGGQQPEQQHQSKLQAQQQQRGRQQQLLRLDRTGSRTISDVTNNDSSSSVLEEPVQQQHPTNPSRPLVAAPPSQTRMTSSPPYPPETTSDLRYPPPPPPPHIASHTAAVDPLQHATQPTAQTHPEQLQLLPTQPKSEEEDLKVSDPRPPQPSLPAAADSVTPHLPTPQGSSGGIARSGLLSAPSPPPRSQVRSRTHTGLVDTFGSSSAEAASSAPLPELPPWMIPHAGLANHANAATTKAKIIDGMLGNNRCRSSSSWGAVGASGGVDRGLSLAPLPDASGLAGSGGTKGPGGSSIGLHALAHPGESGGGEGGVLTRPTRILPATGVPVMPKSLATAATATPERHTLAAAAMHPAVAADSGGGGDAPIGAGSSPLASCTDGEARAGAMRSTASSAQFAAAFGMLHLQPPPPFSPPLAMRQVMLLSSSPLRAGTAVVVPPAPMSPPLPYLPSPLRPVVVPPPLSGGGGYLSSSCTSSGTATPVYSTVMPLSSSTPLDD